jgi:hypothetical protein
MTTVRCSYCGQPAVFRKKPYGSIWECAPCDARVGCHRGGRVPKGTLANAALRAARIAAHSAFDPLWQEKMKTSSKTQARLAGYHWLASMLQIEPDACHIALFDIAQCMRVVDICAPYVTRINRNRQSSTDETHSQPNAPKGTRYRRGSTRGGSDDSSPPDRR